MNINRLLVFIRKKKLGNFILGVVAVLGMAAYNYYFSSDTGRKKSSNKNTPQKVVQEKPTRSTKTTVADKNNDDVTKPSEDFGKDIGLVAFIPDGDTLHLKDGTKVRLLGINCPEIYHDQKLSQRYAEEAKQHLVSLTKDKNITIRYHRKNKEDIYQRVLADVFVNDLWVNLDLVANGYAFVYTTADVSLDEKLYIAEVEAQKEKRGLWNLPNSVDLFKQYQPHWQKEELMTFVGKTILAQGKVTKCSMNKGAMIINFDSLEGLSARVTLSRKNFLHFPEISVTDFADKTIAVIGRVTIYRGNPEISIRYPTDIFVDFPE